MSTINGIQSGRIGTGAGLKIIGAELKEGLMDKNDSFKSAVKSGRTSTIKKFRGGAIKKRKKK